MLLRLPSMPKDWDVESICSFSRSQVVLVDSPIFDGNSGITAHYKGVTVESVCSLFEIADGSCGQSDPGGDVDS